MDNADDIDDIAVVVYDGFDELDAVGPYEVFRNAADYGRDVPVDLVTLAPRERVTASHGLAVEPDGALGDDPDLLVVPGGGWNDGGDVGARGEAERGDLPDALRERADRGSAIAAVCTGGMLLAEAGLLDGRPAVTHAGALDDLRATGARVVDARVVDDGDVLTAGGVTSGLDLAFHVVGQVWDGDVAERVATEMEYEPRGDVYAPDDT
ncbi:MULTISPECIES: DJ-1/PfpI family protein [Halorussus]|uniref:DJ-1/PfpI family protein n=1 Tax=Halorussus TaxID=1070314 RepID=UPI000E216EFE|nr:MULTISPECIES: DJ-1/PfpI family protein [Halorussus]NHN61079.1 DJ-1/PfpI family protein [Halorussus sp. JP-T4]